NIEQGQHSWSVNCTDDAGNVVGSDKRDFNVDTSKPNVELNQPTNYYNSSSDEVNFNWTATDNLAEEMMCDLIINEEVSESAIKSVNDTSNTHTVSNVEQGHHNWSVNCTDDAGNVGESEKRDFTVDIQEPGVALEEPINYYNSSSDSINFNWTATDNLADEMKCDLIINEEINESAIKSVNDTYTNYTVDNIEQGQHSWSVNCTDDAGNSNQSAVYDFTVDTTNPPIELYKPIDETYFAITNVTFNWTATDNIAEEIKCDLIINDSVNETLIENNNTVFEHKVTNLAEGYHNWSVNCTDDAGNFNETETRIFGVDTTDPVTQITSPEEGSWQNSEFNVEFSDSDEGQGLDYCEYRVIDDGSTSVDWSERDCNEGISVDLDDCSTDGEDICKVESRVSDFAGNSANESRNFSIDTGGISCNIDMVSMSNYSYADANTLYYNTLVSGSFNATASISTTVSGTKKVDFPNTVSGGKILETEPFYRIYNWDTGDEFDGKATVETVNNAGTRGECDFYAIRDITPPKEGYVEYPNGFISEHEVEVEFSAGIDDESGINESSGRLQIRNTTLEDGECNTFGDWTTVYEGDDTASPHKTETLADGKCYQFQYKVNDNVENEAVFNKSEDDEIQTTKFDTASPRVEIKQNATQIEFAHESIELNWSAVDYSIDEVDFNVITPSGEKVYESSNEEGQIELTPKDLTTTGKYEISLYARDKSGNENSTSAEFEVVDTNPPKITTIPDNETIEYGTKWDGVDFEAQDPSGIDQWSVNDTNFEINETGFVSSKEKTPALGKHIINVSVEDNEGNLDYAIFELEVIDTIPPYVEVEMNATELEFSKESINISWNSTDLNLDSTKLNITCPDNEILEHSQEETGEIILTPQKLEKTGEYEVSLFANDTSGNENSTSAEFEIVDTIPPEFTTIPENKTVEYVDGFAGVDFEAQDPSGIDEWSVNDTNKFEINATGFLKPKQKLALGIHRVNVSVTDNEGNKNWVIYEVEIIDTTVPNIELETPKNNSYSTQKANEFSWNATDRADEELICELIINEEMAKSNISSENSTITTQKTKLEEGVNEWSVNCSDSSGNWNKTGTRILTVDTTQPKINLIKPGVNEFTQEKNITFSWNATDTLSEKLSCDLIVNSKINVSSIESGNDSITSTTVDAFDEGLHNWSINCTDNAGNSQKHEYNFFKVDTTPPQIVSPEPEEGGILAENPVNFSWKAIDQLSHDMDCKLYINNVLENETSAENNTLGTFSKDMSTGNHNWSINCVDKAGNEASAFNEFILDLKEPAVKLGLPKDNYETGETNVEFNCSAKDNFGMENLTIFVWDENKEINFTDTTEDTNKNAKNSWTIELEHGNFEWNCQAFDSAGKKNWAKNNKSLSIHTIPPEITESSVENISSIGAELSWQTDNPADSVVYYGKNPGKLNKTEKDDRFKTEHNIKLHYLKEETTYYYKTGSCDEFGNCKNSTVESFETDPVQPPELESHYPHYEPIILNDEEQDFYVEVTDPQGNDYFVEWYLNGEKVESGNNYTYVGDEKQGKFEHEIKVNATNLQRDATITWNLTQTDYPVTKELDGDTTDLSKEENLEDVTNLTMEKTGTGKISFGESAVNLSGIANLDPFIRLENGVVGLNSKLLKSFEQPATIYMYGLNFSSIPDIYHSENFTQETEDILNECPEDKCSNINYNAATGILSFDVSGFSVFRATINTGEMPKIDEPEKEKKASRPVKVPHLRFAEEIVKPGEEATLHINLDNLDYDDIEGLRVKLGIPELGVQRTKGPFDLEHSDNVYKQINLRVPEYAQPGLYNARITVTDSNNKVRRTIHRDLTVR
ncbi:MAG: Ig-like domain-containing protein, partial [Nanoarchaeota archaeon]